MQCTKNYFNHDFVALGPFVSEMSLTTVLQQVGVILLSKEYYQDTDDAENYHYYIPTVTMRGMMTFLTSKSIGPQVAGIIAIVIAVAVPVVLACTVSNVTEVGDIVSGIV